MFRLSMCAWAKNVALITSAFALISCNETVEKIDSKPLSANKPSGEALVRNTDKGLVGGMRFDSGVQAWLGIPFAEAPVGQLRWRAPTMPTAWSGVKAADEYGAPCVQFPTRMIHGDFEYGDVIGDEDCLYLNVFVPPMVETSKEKLPVMFWIHGGGNTTEDTSRYSGEHLAKQQNVIVVSTSYRLGPLGWFRHKELMADYQSPKDKSGNFATLDLIRALEWTRDNITTFGGNKENVTIFGESAGGVNVFSLLQSPLASGLFHKAITQSGILSFSSIHSAEEGHVNSSNNIAKRLIKAHDLPSVESIRALSAKEILAAYRVNTPSHEKELGMFDLPAVIADGYVLPKNAGIDVFENNQHNRVPILMGTNRDESKLFMSIDPNYIDKWFGFWIKSKDRDIYERDAYYMSSLWRIIGAENPARAIHDPVYVYRFDWDELAKVLGMDMPHLIGAAHVLDVSFVLGEFSLGKDFDRVQQTKKNLQGREDLSRIMMTYWGNFARTGNPNIGESVPLEWQPWQQKEQFIVFDSSNDKGITTSSDSLTPEKLLAQLKADKRFQSPHEQCELLSNMAEHSVAILSWKSTALWMLKQLEHCKASQ
ncbi:MAG: carboxylesterase family protein [Ketobacter sp.]